MPPLTRTSTGWLIRQPTLTLAIRRCVAQAIDEHTPDVSANIESHFFDMTLVADSCEFDLDIGKELWLNKGRWSRLTREYINDGKLGVYLEGARTIYNGKGRKGAVVNMLFRDPFRYSKKHRWGGCLMGATFRGCPTNPGDPSTITFYSRTTYMGYMGCIDAAIAAKLAETIDPEGDPTRIGFKWHIGSMQLHCFKTLPWVFSKPKLYRKLQRHARRSAGVRSRPEGEPPTWWYMSKWYNKILESFDEYGVDMLAHEKYGPFKRIKRRWLEHERHLSKNVPPTLTLDMLDFSKAEKVDDEQ